MEPAAGIEAADAALGAPHVPGTSCAPIGLVACVCQQVSVVTQLPTLPFTPLILPQSVRT